jgi:hypothetical protein
MPYEINHFYVFYVTKEGDNMYERTTGDEQSAIQRVDDLMKSHPNALFTKNELPEGYFY